MFCMHHTTCRGCFAQGPACSLPHAPAVDTLIELCALPCLCSTPLPSIVKGAPREQPQLACQSVHLCRRAAFCVSTHQALVSAASWGLWQGDYNEVQAIANTDGSSRWSKLSFGTSYVKGARHPKARVWACSDGCDSLVYGRSQMCYLEGVIAQQRHHCAVDVEDGHRQVQYVGCRANT